jgi:hypothetical protein
MFSPANEQQPQPSIEQRATTLFHAHRQAIYIGIPTACSWFSWAYSGSPASCSRC